MGFKAVVIVVLLGALTGATQQIKDSNKEDKKQITEFDIFQAGPYDYYYNEYYEYHDKDETQKRNDKDEYFIEEDHIDEYPYGKKHLEHDTQSDEQNEMKSTKSRDDELKDMKNEVKKLQERVEIFFSNGPGKEEEKNARKKARKGSDTYKPIGSYYATKETPRV